MTATEFARGGHLRRLRQSIAADPAVTEAAVQALNAANPPASRELSEPPAGPVASPAPQRTRRSNRPAATSVTAEAR